jgi:hypothetical protein
MKGDASEMGLPPQGGVKGCCDEAKDTPTRPKQDGGCLRVMDHPVESLQKPPQAMEKVQLRR